MDVGMQTMVEIVGKYGIGTLVILVLCFISYRIIKHLLNQSDVILKAFVDINEKWQKAIDDHTVQAREFHSQVKDAHDYQRKEHEKMLVNLDTLNEQAKKTCDCLDDVKEGLVRVNGFHK